MINRRLGRLGYMSSIVMYGAASLAKVSQEEADHSIQYALQHGVNHFDTARSYGESEVRLAPWMQANRDQIFLATKTGKQTKEDAKAQIYESLERLQVDQLDLIQLHAVCDLDDLNKRMGKGGALESVLEAKEEGLVKAIGITGHTHSAPAVHLEAILRFPFDAVLTPLNYHLYSIPAYRDHFDALMEETRRQDIALRVIKAVAKGPWPENKNKKYATWYEPFDQQKIIDACVTFVLSFKEISGLASAGDIQLFPQVVSAVTRYGEMSKEEAEDVLAKVQDYSSPFAGM